MPHMWVAKLYYFLFYGAIGSMTPFLNIYFQQRGLTGAEIGLLGSIPPLIGLFAGPFWAGIADKTRRHQLILAVGVFVDGVLSFPFLWASGFWPMLGLVILYAFFRAPVPSLIDSATLSMIKYTGANYGRQRLFGSLGYVVSTYGVGLVVTASNLGLFFVIHAAFLLLGCTVLSFFLPVDTVNEPVDLFAGLRRLARHRGYVSFLVMNVLQGMGSAAFLGFLGLRLVEIGATEQQVGLAFALAGWLRFPAWRLAAGCRRVSAWGR
jgi:MFS transporter, PPP family, 3-phenylpropionic acid transporter